MANAVAIDPLTNKPISIQNRGTLQRRNIVTSWYENFFEWQALLGENPTPTGGSPLTEPVNI